jgi:IclR family acetate operon transcriptional repressor
LSPELKVRAFVPQTGTEGASRVIDVLLFFLDESNAIGISQISRELDLSKAVVHRIFRSLVAKDMIIQDPQSRLYTLGPAAAALGARAFRDSNLRIEATPILSALRDLTRETATLSELVGHDRAYIEQFSSPQEIKMLVEIGRRFPLHAGSSSKAILAFLDSEQQQEVIDGTLARLTPETVVDRDQLAQELKIIQHQGYAVSRGERQRGAGAVAAPVFNLVGLVIGAISICGPADRFDEVAVNSLIPLVTRAAHQISVKLGADSNTPSQSITPILSDQRTDPQS